MSGNHSHDPVLEAMGAEPLDRRRFLQMMSATLAAAGIGPGDPPPRDIVPNVIADPATTATAEARYATAIELGGYAEGVLVRHQGGRPIQVEGNPDHPASRGGSSSVAQAAILDLYDPARAQALVFDGRIRDWPDFQRAIGEARAALMPGKGLRILSGHVTAPSLRAQIADLAKAYGDVRWHRWEPAGHDNAWQGAALAYGRPLEIIPRIDKAKVILSVDSDLLDFAPGRLSFARDFAAGRGAGNRLYALESSPNLTGAAADHRLALAPDRIEIVLRALTGSLGAGPASPAPVEFNTWIAAVAADLNGNRGAALLHAGPGLPPAQQAIVQAINAKLGAPQILIEPLGGDPGSLAELMADLAAGKVGMLVILGGDPAYTAPIDLDLAGAIRQANFSLYLGAYRDQTAKACHWHVPEAHPFEAWGDARAFDGTATILQPQTKPLFGGRSAIELLAALQGTLDPDGAAIVRAQWREHLASDSDWSAALRQGVVPGSAAPPVTAAIKSDLWDRLPAAIPAGSGLTAIFRPDPAAYDGRFIGNAWLQELPRPLTRITWDNAALLGPATAQRLGVADGDIVTLAAGDDGLRAPVLVVAGQAEDCVTLPLGYGRVIGENPASAVAFIAEGFDIRPLRASNALWQRTGIELAKTGTRYAFASTQHHHTMEGNDLLRRVAFAEAAQPAAHEVASSLYTPHDYPGRAWGMAIDLSSCIGCGACVTACQAENNIPVVGKAEVARGREMQWLRVDAYEFGEGSSAEAAFQPVPCMHCENAPCEVVCPVEATSHDSEGVNAMVYNRCVGTRFCANNCPYKVRRFNFFGYAEEEQRDPHSRNSDVTVRSRGVMEKCTYCIQRIRKAEIAADIGDRPVRDGEVVTACQAACPTQAIVFGDINDPASAVRRRKGDPRDYLLLGELNTRPRTSYAARVLNRNPAIKEG
jgi:Fe-S-cluster-containing dehydrogenase component